MGSGIMLMCDGSGNNSEGSNSGDRGNMLSAGMEKGNGVVGIGVADWCVGCHVDSGVAINASASCRNVAPPANVVELPRPVGALHPGG